MRSDTCKIAFDVQGKVRKAIAPRMDVAAPAVSAQGNRIRCQEQLPRLKHEVEKAPA
jgi:hypothetical protein